MLHCGPSDNFVI